jgi:hypothetical protein
MYDPNNFEFIHIPKCAGTSIRRALDVKKMGHNPVRTNNDIDEETLVCAFVRNPFDRITSFYRWNKRRNIFRIKSENITFEDWFYKTIANEERPYFYNPSYWKPAYWWLCDDNGHFRANAVGKVENIEEDFKSLCKLLQKDVILPNLNTTENKGDEVYTDDMKRIMYDVYEDDFNQWYPNA